MRSNKPVIIDKKVILGATFTVVVCFFYYLLIANGLSHKNALEEVQRANITLIPGPAVATMDLGLLTSITPTATIDPAIQNVEGIFIGAYVQISGTGGSGLRIRANAGTATETMFLGNESEVFQVIGGPVYLDEIVWWQLSAPYDETRQGWAAADYLLVLEQ